MAKYRIIKQILKRRQEVRVRRCDDREAEVGVIPLKKKGGGGASQGMQWLPGLERQETGFFCLFVCLFV